MHELAIAQSIVQSVAREKALRHLGKISVVGVKIGELTDVMPEALEFGFQALVAEGDLAGCVLKIERVAIAGTCRTCQKALTVHNLIFSCPHCFSTDLDIQSGQELEIAYLEIDDDDGHKPG